MPRPDWLTPKWMKENGYLLATEVRDGPYAGSYMAITKMLFNYRLVVGMDEVGWDCVYDYESLQDAAADIVVWDGRGDPPGPWVKYRGPGGERVKNAGA